MKRMFCLIKRILNGELIWWGVAVFQKMKRYFSMVIERRRQLSKSRPGALRLRAISPRAQAALSDGM